MILIVLTMATWATIGGWITPQLFEEKGLNKMAGRGAGIAAGALGSLFFLLILWGVVATFPAGGRISAKPSVQPDGETDDEPAEDTPATPPIDRVANLKQTANQYLDRLVPYGPAVERLVFALGGLLLGMILTGWILPVRFANNAEPAQLEESYRDQWVKGAAAEYELTDDPDEVERKLIAAGYGSDEVRALARQNESAPVGTWLTNIEDIAASADQSAQDKQSQYPGPTWWSEIVMPLLGILSIAGLGALLALFLSSVPNPISRRFS